MKVYCDCSIDGIITSMWMGQEDLMKEVKPRLVVKYKKVFREK